MKRVIFMALVVATLSGCSSTVGGAPHGGASWSDPCGQAASFASSVTCVSGGDDVMLVSPRVERPVVY